MIAAAVCPHPPLLVEPFDRSGVADLEPVRAAAREAVADLVRRSPGRVVVLAHDEVVPGLDESAGGNLQPWGVAVPVGGRSRELGLAHAVGAWLLDDAGWTGSRAYVDRLDEVRADDAVLAVVDGTTRRTERSPGSFDDRAEGFDQAVESALGSGDAAALVGLDLDLAAELGVVGSPTLVELGRAASDRPVDATLRHASAPLGVGYWVATWDLGS